MAVLLAVAAGCVAMYTVLDAISELTEFLDEIADISGVDHGILLALLKGLGIALIARFAGDMCRDAGMITASAAVEWAGSAAILYTALPVMRTVFQMIRGLLS